LDARRPAVATAQECPRSGHHLGLGRGLGLAAGVARTGADVGERRGAQGVQKPTVIPA